ncbi:hypothetical protein K3495_g15615, partial [Podosphaera aphanis]
MHIRNRLPTSALPYGPEDTRPGINVTPISAFSDKTTTLNKLRIFGCAAFPLVFKETKPAFSKFAPNIETDWIFIGIQSNSIWVLLNRRTGAEQRSVDCEFKEHIFPGMMCQDLQSQLGLRSNLNRVIGDSGQDLQSQSGLRSNLNKVIGDSGQDLKSQLGLRSNLNRVIGDSGQDLKSQLGLRSNLNRVIGDSGQDLKSQLGLRSNINKVIGDLGQDLQSQSGLRSKINRVIGDPGQDKCLSDQNTGVTGDSDSRNQNKLQVPFNRANGDSILTTGESFETHEAKKIPVPDKTNLQIITRSGRVAGLNTDNRSSKGFGSSVSLMVRALNALHIEQDQDSTSLGAPSVPFESLTIEQAFSENEEAWKASLLDELKSLERNKTFEIIEGNYKAENGRKLISSRWVLRNKFSADGSIARRKARI